MYTKAGLRKDAANDEGYLALDKVMEAIGMNKISWNQDTAEDPESQFWNNVDNTYNLTEVQMREDIPLFLTDPNSAMKAEAIMDGREETKQLNA